MTGSNLLCLSSSSTRISRCHRRWTSDWNEPSRALCHDIQTRYFRRRRSYSKQIGRRRITPEGCWPPYNFVFVVLLSLLFYTHGAKADGAKFIHRLGQSDKLLIDPRVPPSPPMRLTIDYDPILTARDDFPESDTIESTRDETSQQPQLPLPKPFDTNLGNNFTSSSCPKFFQSFLDHPSFQSCLPLSLLLQNSDDFFGVMRSLVRLTNTLDTACNVNFNHCSWIMNNLAERIQLEENCGADLQMRNPMVEQAYNGFLAYQPLYQAGCIKDTEGSYCFADAVSNTSSPMSSFVYYLPLGVELPAGTKPACNICLHQTMTIFARYATTGNQALSSNYATAAEQVDSYCGPAFVEFSTLATSGGMAVSRSNDIGLLALFICIIYFLF